MGVMLTRLPEIGDLVLATKYQDGDPKDQWCVGYYAGLNLLHPERFDVIVIDSSRSVSDSNGFQKIKKISSERGKFFLKAAPLIESSGRSLWWWARCKMELAPGGNVASEACNHSSLDD